MNRWRNSAFFLLDSFTDELLERWISLLAVLESPVMYIKLMMSQLCTRKKSSFGNESARSLSFLQTVIFLFEERNTVEYDPSDLMCTIS